MELLDPGVILQTKLIAQLIDLIDYNQVPVASKAVVVVMMLGTIIEFSGPGV